MVIRQWSFVRCQFSDVSCDGQLPGFSSVSRFRSLPDAAGVFRHHGLPGLAVKCLLKFRHVANDAVDPVLAR